ncbi:jg5966 [Pararge aegeria aegeria]|uniref:Jg5966 protein n=1 Tax=Pararge aegeria aegeria TaxID=348720 RepID=A0A8S4RDM8_9NEOP|nr:jg5966 [Pararge aegeria aegeria]
MEYQTHRDATAHGVTLFCRRTRKEEKDCDDEISVPPRCTCTTSLHQCLGPCCVNPATRTHSRSLAGRPGHKVLHGVCWETKVCFALFCYYSISERYVCRFFHPPL